MAARAKLSTHTCTGKKGIMRCFTGKTRGGGGLIKKQMMSAVGLGSKKGGFEKIVVVEVGENVRTETRVRKGIIPVGKKRKHRQGQTRTANEIGKISLNQKKKNGGGRRGGEVSRTEDDSQRGGKSVAGRGGEKKSRRIEH